MKVFLLGDKLLSIEGHSRLVPGKLGPGQIPAEDSNMGAYTSGARLMRGLQESRESLVPIHLALWMELRQRDIQLSTGVLFFFLEDKSTVHRRCPNQEGQPIIHW